MKDKAQSIFIISLISNRTQKPRVQIEIDDVKTQMSADAAMDVAKNIIEVCMGAYADAFIWHFVKEKLGQQDAVAGQMIQEFREYRDELAKEFRKEQKEIS
jgi:hypothetical protein